MNAVPHLSDITHPIVQGASNAEGFAVLGLPAGPEDSSLAVARESFEAAQRQLPSAYCEQNEGELLEVFTEFPELAPKIIQAIESSYLDQPISELQNDLRDYGSYLPQLTSVFRSSLASLPANVQQSLQRICHSFGMEAAQGVRVFDWQVREALLVRPEEVEGIFLQHGSEATYFFKAFRSHALEFAEKHRLFLERFFSVCQRATQLSGEDQFELAFLELEKMPSSLIARQGEGLLRILQATVPCVSNTLKELPLSILEDGSAGLEQVAKSYGRDTFGVFAALGCQTLRFEPDYAEFFEEVRSVMTEDEADYKVGRALAGLNVPLLRERQSELRRMLHAVKGEFGEALKGLDQRTFNRFPQEMTGIACATPAYPAEALGSLTEHILHEFPEEAQLLAQYCTTKAGRAYKEFPLEAARNDREHFRKLIHRHEQHIWALFSSFGNDLFAGEHEFQSVIGEINREAGEGAGELLSVLRPEMWRKEGIALAQDFGAAAGYVQQGKILDHQNPESQELFDRYRQRCTEQFELRHYQRYCERNVSGILDLSLLEQNIANSDPRHLQERPLAIVVFPYSDHNNAAAVNGSFGALKELSRYYKLLFVEARTARSAIDSVEGFVRLHGTHADGSYVKPASLVIFCCHGNKDQLRFGERGERGSCLHRHDVPLIDRLHPLLHPYAHCALDACKTAFGGPRAENMAGSFHFSLPHIYLHAARARAATGKYEQTREGEFLSSSFGLPREKVVVLRPGDVFGLQPGTGWFRD